ncbi:MAG: isoleucine--tRNA ligase [bacterium]
MDYSKTINLPKTGFSMKAGLPKLEPDILKKWEDMDIYKALLENNKEKAKYVLHDGPPYANGNIHIGHSLNKILKDIIVKYKAINSFNTPYIPGWDCHGLPIEHKVIERLPKDTEFSEIRKNCREYANKFVNIQREEFKRLGVFGDWNNPYLTFKKEYIIKTLELFKIMVRDGYVYKDKKPVFWCKSCRTALAEAEVIYKEKTSPSIYVKFPYKDKNLLIWTTTPWTLFGNTGIAIHPEYLYQEIEYNKEKIIMMKDLTSLMMKEKEYKVLRDISPKELSNEYAEHPFLERKSKIILDYLVSADSGTGCVHIAPGHGIEDYAAGCKNNLPLICDVDDNGRFIAGMFKDEDVSLADKKIIEYLDEIGMLFKKDEILHSYPHCWRCKKPIIFRATSQWFINIDHRDLRKRIISACDNVEWIPDYGKNRFVSTVEARADWCISRQRAWGIPIPSFFCNDCQRSHITEESIEKTQEIIKDGSIDEYFSNDITSGISCPFCGGKNLIKEKDILDVWFDSGSSHYAVLMDEKSLSWPANLYLEGSDQHRGWFQSSIITAIAGFNRAPYKAVLTHGFILDEKGIAMSKSAGNVISPQEIVEKYGADILRLWVCSVDFREDIKIGKEILSPIILSYRKIRNTFRFLLGNLYDFSCEKSVEYNELKAIDKYILHSLCALIIDVEDSYSKFEFHRAFRLILNFCTRDLSNLYLDVLKDRLYCEEANSLKRRAGQNVLYQCLISLVKLIAPILSFTAEEIWGYINPKSEIRNPKSESVFLTGFPEVNQKHKNPVIKEEMDEILEIRDVVNLALERKRTDKEIASSLEAALRIKTGKFDLLNKYKEELCEIFIVSSIELEKKEGLEIEVSKHKGIKCPRCWMKSFTENRDGLCERCNEVLTIQTF